MTLSDFGQSASACGDAHPRGIAEVRGALAPILATGYRLMAVLVAAGRIPAVASMVDVARRDELAHPSSVRAMPLVSPEKVRC